tara:strand:- start:58 stop:375 length:318 start_codon:yes stop_codon:yes gene_type:complete
MKENSKKWVDVNGAQVMDLTPNHERPLALVDLDVLKKLSALLPSASIRQIKQDFRESLRDVTTMKEYVAMLSKELAFHSTVNLINEIDKEQVCPRDYPEEVININ